MPNSAQHAAVGGMIGVTAYVAMSKYYDRKLDLGELAVCGLAGTLAAGVPDLLEPALSPNHRDVAHSIAMGGLLSKFAMTYSCRENGNWTEFQKILVAVTVIGYISHLVLDGMTPRGLPLLGRIK